MGRSLGTPFPGMVRGGTLGSRQERDYIFIRILNKSPTAACQQALAFMVIGDELPTMPGQAQVVLGPDPKLIFICSCVYNFAHSLQSHFHH